MLQTIFNDIECPLCTTQSQDVPIGRLISMRGSKYYQLTEFGHGTHDFMTYPTILHLQAFYIALSRVSVETLTLWLL